MKLKLHADSVKVNGPKVDGGFSVTLSVGQYEQNEIAKLLMLSQDSVVQVTMEQNENER